MALSVYFIFRDNCVIKTIMTTLIVHRPIAASACTVQPTPPRARGWSEVKVHPMCRSRRRQDA